MIWGFLRPLVWSSDQLGNGETYSYGDGDGFGDGRGDMLPYNHGYGSGAYYGDGYGDADDNN